MKPTILLFVLGAFVTGCSAAPSVEDTREDVRVVARGLNTEPYEGVFSGYRPLEEALSGLPVAIDLALRRMEVRLGISPDPERPRILRVSDDTETWFAESKLIGGRSVQVIALPAAPLAQGRVALSDLLLEALTDAVLDDRHFARLPAWFRNGAPRWISGRMERTLVKRILTEESTPVSEDRVLPGFDPLQPSADALSGAFFLAYLGETFGPEVIPGMVRTLCTAETIDLALQAVLPHDPASLEAGFDTYRIVRVSALAEDPYVVELLSARALPPAERVVRLSGLSSRAPHPMVGAVAAEDLGRAQYLSGDYAGAAETLARVEREYLRDALHPDRDRFLFAMTFVRQDQDSAAALRFENFLLEFPSSEYAPRALFELAGVMLELGRSPDAMARFRELCERYPESEVARKAFLVLGAFEAARHRYALARSHFMRARPEPGAKDALARLDGATTFGLPAQARPVVTGALRDLASPDDSRGEAGILTLQQVGPLAAPLVREAAANSPGGAFDSRMITAVSAWGLDGAVPVLAAILASDRAAAIEDAFAALVTLGATPGRIREILDGLPARSTVAESAWRESYGGKAGVPEVADLMESSDFERRVEAATVLGALERPEAVGALRTLLADTSPAVRRAAAIALGNHRGPDSGEALADALLDESITVRLAVIDSLARLKELAPLRERGLADASANVQLSAAARLLDGGNDADYALVLALLARPDGGLATGVEILLRDRSGPAYEGALVDSLLSAKEDGTAMRIVRLMCRRVDQDLGYDPGGDQAERERVAARFVALIEGP